MVIWPSEAYLEKVLAMYRWKQLCRAVILLALSIGIETARGEDPGLPASIPVEGQPLAANVQRLLEALDYLGAPLPAATRTSLEKAARERNAARLQELLDPQVLFVVALNPEVRVKVQRGPGKAVLQQAAFTPVVVKVINDSTVTKRLRIASSQAGPSYSGTSKLSLTRQQQLELLNNQNPKGADRFLEVDLFQSPPLTTNLSGLKV